MWGGGTCGGAREGFPEGARGSYKRLVHSACVGLSAALYRYPGACLLTQVWHYPGAPGQEKLHQLSN